MNYLKYEPRKTCAITGHRTLPPDFDRNALCDRLEQLIEAGCDRFLCGMALGFDLAALSCLTDLSGRYRVGLEAYIPFLGQEERFSREDKREYRRLLELCDEKRVIFSHYFTGCYLARNREMVDHADVLFAYCMKNGGGTAYTVAYARKRQIPVVFFS